MAKNFVTNRVDGEAAGDWPLIQKEAAKHRRSQVTVEAFSEEREISLQQLRWWKGILLPALSKDNGDSISQWETRLKLATLPDEFQPETVMVNGLAMNYIPSVKKLSVKKTNILVEGSVDHLRDETIYGDHYHWVTLPDPLKRKTQ